LHDGDLDAGDAAEDELAGVAGDGGERPVGNVGVGDGSGVLDLGGEVAEAGAEDDAEGGGVGIPGTDVVCGGGGAGVLAGHFVRFGHFYVKYPIRSPKIFAMKWVR
jgi:hypothetical protein